jgi:hypothetical protein
MSETEDKDLDLADTAGEDDGGRELAGDRPAGSPSRDGEALSRLAIGAIALTLLYAVLLALLAGEDRGGLVRLVTEAPGSSGAWLLGGYVVALAATVTLGLLALVRGTATSVALLPSLLLLGAGGVFSALAAQAGAAKVLAATDGSKNLVLRAALAHAAFPRVIALTGASMLVGLCLLVGLVRLYQVDLPVRRRWGPFVALGLTVLLGASLPLTFTSLSIAISPLSLVPLAAIHYFALAALAFALPRALRLREAGDEALPPLRALLLTCLCGPLATILAWQASVAAARAAPLARHGRPLAEALTLLGPQAVGVTVAAAALVALSGGNVLRRALAPRVPAIAAIVLLVMATGTYVWAAIVESALR